MAEMLFWLSLSFLGVIYAGYPALMVLLARRPSGNRAVEVEARSVTILIAARDEEAVLPSKLKSCLQQDYPDGLLDIVVVSDGSGDESAEVAREVDRNRIRVIELPKAGGKAAALNEGMKVAQGDVVVLTDARQPLAPDAVRALVSVFADQAVGGVSGDLRYDRNSEIGIQIALHRYWDYEKGIRSGESRIHSCVGATGALYAIRRELWSPLPEGLLLDNVYTPMRIVLRGRRVIFEPSAWAVDVASVSDGKEFHRRVRTLTGNYQLLTFLPQLLVPFANPIWAQFMIHKLGRLMSPFLLMALLVSSALASGPVYDIALVAQLVSCCLVAIAFLTRRSRKLPPLLALPYAFAVTQAAAIVAFVHFLRRDWNVWVR